MFDDVLGPTTSNSLSLTLNTAWSCNLRAPPDVSELLQEIWFSRPRGILRPVVSLEGVPQTERLAGRDVDELEKVLGGVEL